MVAVDTAAALHELRLATQQLDVRSPRRDLLELQRAADQALKSRGVAEALESLQRFRALARRIPGDQVAAVVAHADLIATCIRY